MNVLQKLLGALTSKVASRLRFPQLFLLTAALFVLDVLIPDVLPFVDEILLGLITLLLGSLKRPRVPRGDASDDGAE